MKTVNLAFLGVTIVACFGQLIYWYPLLPDVVPSHFDGNGNADGSMSRPAYVALIGALQLLFLVGLPLLGMSIGKLPNSMINIPNKEHWLAPERRDQTMTVNLHFLIVFGWMSGWLMFSIFHLTSLVAVEVRETINPEFYFVMGVFVIAMFGAVVWLLLRFRKPRVN